MTTTEQQATEIGQRIGRAIARDVKAEGMPREWTGLDAQDADQATAAGLTPDTEAWAAMTAAAKAEYERILASGRCPVMHRDGLERCDLPEGHAGPHRSPWGAF